MCPSPVMEIFSAGWTWQVHRMWMDQDPSAQLQWWGLTVEVSTAVARPGGSSTAHLGGCPGCNPGLQSFIPLIWTHLPRPFLRPSAPSHRTSAAAPLHPIA